MKKTLIALMAITTIFVAGCGQNDLGDETVDSTGDTETTLTQTTMQTTPNEGDTVAILQTSHGDIKMLLYTEKTPETTKNFIELTNADKYDGVKFHRVIDDFMIQTGDFERGDGMGGHSYKGPGTNLEDEFAEGLEHIYGAVSMANTGWPNTGGSQFFIVQKKDGTDWLDGKHAIFGYVYEGMDVVEKIAAVEVDGNAMPLEDITIEDVIIEQYK